MNGAPDIIGGRRVRVVDVEVAPDLCVSVLEAADGDVVLEESALDPADLVTAVLRPSAIAAAARLPAILRPGMSLLDLSAGTGIVAITAARLGARATAVDGDAFTRAAVTEAARLAGVAVTIAQIHVRGDDPLPAADIVVMTDLLHDPELARAAARRALEALHAGATVLVCDGAGFGRVEFARVLETAGTPVVFDDVVVRLPGDPLPSRVGIALLEHAT